MPEALIWWLTLMGFVLIAAGLFNLLCLGFFFFFVSPPKRRGEDR